MLLSNQGFNYILFATCEISNYVICILIQKANAVTIAEALLNRVVYQFGPPKTLKIDEARTLCRCITAYIQYSKHQITGDFSIESWFTENRKIYNIYY